MSGIVASSALRSPAYLTFAIMNHISFAPLADTTGLNCWNAVASGQGLATPTEADRYAPDSSFLIR